MPKNPVSLLTPSLRQALCDFEIAVTNRAFAEGLIPQVKAEREEEYESSKAKLLGLLLRQQRLALVNRTGAKVQKAVS